MVSYYRLEQIWSLTTGLSGHGLLLQVRADMVPYYRFILYVADMVCKYRYSRHGLLLQVRADMVSYYRLEQTWSLTTGLSFM